MSTAFLLWYERVHCSWLNRSRSWGSLKKKLVVKFSLMTRNKRKKTTWDWIVELVGKVREGDSVGKKNKHSAGESLNFPDAEDEERERKKPHDLRFDQERGRKRRKLASQSDGLTKKNFDSDSVLFFQASEAKFNLFAPAYGKRHKKELSPFSL